MEKEELYIHSILKFKESRAGGCMVSEELNVMRDGCTLHWTSMSSLKDAYKDEMASL
jgi:hypothetical protein